MLHFCPHPVLSVTLSCSTSAIHIWGRYLSVYCPVYCEIFSGIPGLYPVDAGSILLPSFEDQKCLQILSGGNYCRAPSSGGAQKEGGGRSVERDSGKRSRSLLKDSALLAQFWLPPGAHQSSRRVSGSPFSKSAVGLSSFRVSEMLVSNKKRLHF